MADIFPKKKSFFARHLNVILSIAIIFVILFIGIFIGKKIEHLKVKQYEIAKLINKGDVPDFLITDEVDFKLFWSVWEKLRTDYAHQPVDEVDLFYGAMRGMVAGLKDPYSVFLEPQTAEEFQLELSGKFEGIGAEIGIRDNILTIISPLLDSPAENAGIKPGDKILAIDDYDTSGIALDHAVKLIRGEKGTKVKLLISRDGLKDAKEVEIVRDKIIIKSVQWSMLDNNIAHIKLLQFGTDTVKDFNKVIKQVILKNPNGVILDLRNNPGGFLDAAVKVAGEWVPNDIVVYEKHKGQLRPFTANGKGRLKDFKTIVLINGGSASASEIVSGALQDYNKATIVGEKSFGKGSVQDYNEFGDGSALKLTIALWLTPNENSIEGEGIAPDVEIIPTEEDERDVQLEKAVSLILE